MCYVCAIKSWTLPKVIKSCRCTNDYMANDYIQLSKQLTLRHKSIQINSIMTDRENIRYSKIRLIQLFHIFKLIIILKIFNLNIKILTHFFKKEEFVIYVNIADLKHISFLFLILNYQN